MNAERDSNGQFPRGVSGNPGGRPKEREEFKLRARRIVDEHVLDAWEEEIKTKGPGWVKCSELVTAYALGKPPAAPEELEAGRDLQRLPLSREEMLKIARGEAP